MEKGKINAVITGDLIYSSALTDEKKKQLESSLGDFIDGNPDILLSIEFYRGDSFQLMVKKEKAANVAVNLQAIVFSATGGWARLSIGVGAVSNIVKNNVLRSEGEAFVLSGRQLDKMKEEGRMLKIALGSRYDLPALQASFYLAESIISEWKPGQAAVIAQIPYVHTQKEIAQNLDISEAAVSKALKAGKWPAIEAFIDGYEKTIKAIYQ